MALHCQYNKFITIGDDTDSICCPGSPGHKQHGVRAAGLHLCQIASVGSRVLQPATWLLEPLHALRIRANTGAYAVCWAPQLSSIMGLRADGR